MDPNDVFVVRNGPDLTRFAPVAPRPEWRRGAAHLIAYVGVMGPQDGVDHALRALAALRARRDDWHAVLVGDGDAQPAMRALAGRLGLARCVEFAGWREDDDIRARALDGRRLPGARPAEPAERLLDDDQDPRVHGHRAGDRLLRPRRVAGVGGATPRSTRGPAITPSWAAAWRGC